LLRDVDVKETTARMLQFLEPSFHDAQVRAVLDRASVRSAHAICDPALVEQVLLNLLKNAVEALNPGGTITVTVSQTAGIVTLDIADDGPGLEVEAKAQLFSPFTTTKGAGGTGLGLAVSRRLARSLYGDLVHIPTERGTCWRLTLPAAPAS
jgi:signal transduction histidine kinase